MTRPAATFRRKPSVPQKLHPLEIGLYIGERIAEWGWQPLSREKLAGTDTLRLRFVSPQNLEIGQKCSYYLWNPYKRLPIYVEVVVCEVENDRAYWYNVTKSAEVEKWPPGPGYV